MPLRRDDRPRIALALRAWLTLALALCALACAAARRARCRRVASINLCADQLVLDARRRREQILTVSWLSADPEESLLATEAARYPLNYGTAEELLRFHPDVVIAGAYTNAFTRALLIRLGYRVVELEPETHGRRDRDATCAPSRARSVASERGEQLVATIRAEVARLRGAPPRARARHRRRAARRLHGRRALARATSS